MRTRLLAALMVALGTGACSTAPDQPVQPSAVQTGSIARVAAAKAEHARQVVAERPSRIYIVAGFNETDCSATAADIKVATPPAKGEVTFKPGQMTTIQSSLSGKCKGKSLPGTAIYYTARKGQSGADSFAVTARTPTGAPMTQAYTVDIVE